MTRWMDSGLCMHAHTRVITPSGSVSEQQVLVKLLPKSYTYLTAPLLLLYNLMSAIGQYALILCIVHRRALI